MHVKEYDALPANHVVRRRVEREVNFLLRGNVSLNDATGQPLSGTALANRKSVIEGTRENVLGRCHEKCIAMAQHVERVIETRYPRGASDDERNAIIDSLPANAEELFGTMVPSEVEAGLTRSRPARSPT